VAWKKLTGIISQNYQTFGLKGPKRQVGKPLGTGNLSMRDALHVSIFKGGVEKV